MKKVLKTNERIFNKYASELLIEIDSKNIHNRRHIRNWFKNDQSFNYLMRHFRQYQLATDSNGIIQITLLGHDIASSLKQIKQTLTKMEGI